MPVTIDPEGREIAALEALVPMLDGAHVVEIGCGDGRLTRRYARRAASVLAIDPDEAAITAFRANPAEGCVDIRALAVDRLDLPLNSVDVMLLSWSL